MIALFCGSRHWTDRDAIRRDIKSLPPSTVIVEGGARGADRIAREIAVELGIHCATVPANWRRHGNGAGPRRNAAMLLLKPDVVYAYPLGGVGTAGMIRLAEEAGVPVYVRATGEEAVPTTT